MSKFKGIDISNILKNENIKTISSEKALKGINPIDWHSMFRVNRNKKQCCRVRNKMKKLKNKKIKVNKIMYAIKEVGYVKLYI